VQAFGAGMNGAPLPTPESPDYDVFCNGGKYSFSGVDKESYNKLMESDTKGSYLHKMGLKGTKIEEVNQ